MASVHHDPTPVHLADPTESPYDAPRPYDLEPSPFDFLLNDDEPHDPLPPPAPTTDLAGFLKSVCGYWRSQGTEAGDLVAGRLELLADVAADLGAGATPQAVERAVMVLEAEHSMRSYDRGFAEGSAAVERRYDTYPLN